MSERTFVQLEFSFKRDDQRQRFFSER